MDEHRLGAGRSERGGDLARHVPRLAHARADHTPFGVEDRLDRPGERIAQRVGEGAQGVRLDGQDAPAHLNSVEGAHRDSWSTASTAFFAASSRRRAESFSFWILAFISGVC